MARRETSTAGFIIDIAHSGLLFIIYYCYNPFGLAAGMACQITNTSSSWPATSPCHHSCFSRPASFVALQPSARFILSAILGVGDNLALSLPAPAAPIMHSNATDVAAPHHRQVFPQLFRPHIYKRPPHYFGKCISGSRP